MGWYTSGPAGMIYKYGDVLHAARSSGLGRAWAAPRVYLPEHEREDLEFLSDIQKAALQHDLDWATLPFGPSGDSIPISIHTNPWSLLEGIQNHILAHADTIAALLKHTGEQITWPIEGTVSLEVSWDVAPEEYDALLAWLNDPFPEPRLTIDSLKPGRLDSRPWYLPPPELEPAFAALERDGPRHLVACMLGAMAVSGDPFSLYQPDDPCQLELVLESDLSELRIAVLFRLADYPLVEALAKGFGVPASERERVFYVYQSDEEEVVLPPETSEPTPDVLDAGLSFVSFFTRVLLACEAVEFLAPENSAGQRRAQLGWHTDASAETLSTAFAAVGVAPLPLSAYLRASNAGLVQSSPEEGLAFCKTLADADEPLPGMRYLVYGGERPKSVGVAELVLWLLCFSGRDLPVTERRRLYEMLEQNRV